MSELCVCCGKPVPEGSMVCADCTNKYNVPENVEDTTKEMLHCLFLRCKLLINDERLCKMCAFTKQCEKEMKGVLDCGRC
jgi:hypothetical protein